MKNEVPISDIKGKVDFGIITIREDEFEAVLNRFPTENFTRGDQIYSLSRLETSNGDEYLIASVRCPEQGNSPGQTVAHHLIQDLDPQWILLVGIGGSVPNEENTLGDVVLGSRLHDFSISARIEKGDKITHEFEGRGGPMHPAIQELIAAIPALKQFFDPWNTPEELTVDRPKVVLSNDNFYGNEQWQEKVKNSLKPYFGKKPIRQNPAVVTGSVASSNTLVKDTTLAQQWIETARQVRAIEMELSGVYEAAWKKQKPVLAIRGISDIVGFKRSPQWTKYACHSAASFTLSLLKSRPIKPLGEKSEETDEKDSESSLVIRPISVFTKLPPVATHFNRPETLYSNFLKVSYFPDTLYAVHTDCEDRAEVWNLLKAEVDEPPEDWAYQGHTLYAFHNFDKPYWKQVTGTELGEPHLTARWSHTDNIKDRNIFIELLRKCLIEFGKTKVLSYRHRKPLRFLYYSPTEDLSPRKISTKSLKREAPHTVFKAYRKKTGEVMYYRHHALKFEFEFIDGDWYLQITPTYHYTWNGYKVFRYYEDLISGIKRQENNEAVFRQVLFWAEVLKEDESNFVKQAIKYPYLQFGDLVECRVQFGLMDHLWTNKESLAKRKAKSKQELLFK
jgi:nucleoside phosphorylase